MGKHLAVSGVAQCLLGMAILVAASQTAMAQTTTLICNLDRNIGFTAEDPTTVELNEAQSSVVVNYPAITYPGTSGPTPAYSMGPLAATFAAGTIVFSDGPNLSFTINRLTGRMVNSANWRWTCQAGKKQF